MTEPREPKDEPELSGVIGFGEALTADDFAGAQPAEEVGFGWAEAVATPDEDVGFVFTRLDADFTGLPVDVSIGDDTPLVIAEAKSLEPETIAAIRHWVVKHQAALTDHWRDRIGSLELIERLKKL
jgi:hypothetical protein